MHKWFSHCRSNTLACIVTLIAAWLEQVEPCLVVTDAVERHDRTNSGKLVMPCCNDVRYTPCSTMVCWRTWTSGLRGTLCTLALIPSLNNSTFKKENSNEVSLQPSKDINRLNPSTCQELNLDAMKPIITGCVLLLSHRQCDTSDSYAIKAHDSVFQT